MNRRLLLGSADELVVQRVSSVCEELGDELVHVCVTSNEVPDAVSGFQPDVLILAESLGPVPVLDLIRQIARQDPFVGILLLSSTSDPELFRVAMEAGARSIAPLGFTIDDLGQRIESAAAWAGIVRSHIAGDTSRVLGSGHVVALAGSKGGVGTSTLAVHTALEAAADGRRTCLVDLDLQTGDLSTLLNISHRRDVTDLIGLVGEISGQTLDDVLFRHTSGLHVLLGPREGERAEEITEAVGRAVIGALKSRFDVVVVDVGSVLTPAGASAVEIADRAVLVATPDVLSMRGCRRTARLWDRLRLRPEKDVTVLLNRISRGVEVQPDLAARLARLPISEVGVPASFRSFEAAANTGDPQRLVDRDTRRALARVAESLGVRQPAETARRSAETGRRAARRRDAGQVAIEFMGLLPLLGIVLACLVQGVLIGYGHVLAGQAAAAAARVAVSPDRSDGDIEARARQELPGAWQDGLTVTVGDRWSDPDSEVTVRVTTPSFIPGVTGLFGDALIAESTAQMRFEGRRP
ncbi:AAA family ATPase [Kineosporia succinea]|uniref:Pilus assembly protein CpaE n=1 Tax=Kineosporia succinea TaxID=84632 RepID=A0ABT9P1N6_9ACTN|nr:AAA family ATPase [Kineosporia succinea]MDP9826598.1 pilus assembly protein CpaE [Kineosporia succinea]